MNSISHYQPTSQSSALKTNINCLSSQNSAPTSENPFILAANPLLTLMTQIKHCSSEPDLNKIRSTIIKQINLFAHTLLRNIPKQRVLAAHYCLCTTIDEVILKTKWGVKSIWSQQSLLSLFHKETWGGERFYIILENISKEPRENLLILEFLYLLLNLGFEGKYFDKNKTIRDEIRNRVFERIRIIRGKSASILSAHWKDQEAMLAKKQSRSFLKGLLTCTILLLILITSIVNIKAHFKTKGTILVLNSLAKESAISIYSQLLNRSIVINSLSGKK